MKIFLLLVFAIFTCGAQTIFAQAEEPNCAVSAWITDKDPNGLNVRDKPGIDGKVIAKLKHGNTDDDIVMVYIIGYSNGWVKISNATTVGGEELFSDIGWVSAKMVTTGTKGSDGSYDKPAPLYALPKSSSKKIGTIPSETNVQITGYDCFGLKVKYKGVTGWLSAKNICGNPVTTCP